jgi:(1->4)-alpha-D-glucan 1-alpha-D-glucosylmutase
MRGPTSGQAFTFSDAMEQLDYLDRVGVSHLYLSPILTAAKGSTHGYDVTDPTTVSEELGGPAGLARLSEAVHAWA